jgi:photosystem II stability/assembly factor-like uncharacterized protein
MTTPLERWRVVMPRGLGGTTLTLLMPHATTPMHARASGSPCSVGRLIRSLGTPAAVLMVAGALVTTSCGTKATQPHTPPASGGDHNWVNVISPTTTSSMTSSIKSIVYIANTWLAATPDGIHRSTDGGITWSLQPYSPTDATCMHATSGTVLAGTQGGDIMASMDGGATWKTHSSQISSPPYAINCIASRATTLFAGTHGGGIYIKQDNGPWISAPRQPDNRYISCITFLGGHSIAGTLGGGAYLSDDDGLNWTALSPLPLGASVVHAITTIDNTVIAATNRGIALSFDSGASWRSGATPRYVGTGGDSYHALGKHGAVLLTSNALGGVLRSIDGGLTWNGGTNYASDGAASLVGFASNGSLLMTGSTSRGLHRSLDGGATWMPAGNAADHSIEQVVSAGGALIVGDSLGSIHRQNSIAAPWTTTSSNYLPIRYLLSTSTRTLAVRGDGYLLQSSDQGATFSSLSGPLLSGPIHSAANIGPRVVLGKGDGAATSSNDGESWETIGSLPPTAYVSFTYGAGVIIAASSQGLLRSNDGGGSWAPPTTPPSTTAVHTLAFVSGGELGVSGSFVAGTEQGIFSSRDMGATWQAATLQPGLTAIRCLAVDNGRVFAGTMAGGVYESLDGGNHWRAMSASPWRTDTKALHVFRNALYAATGRSGLWMLPL